MLPLTALDQALSIPAGGIASRPLLDLPGGTKVVLFALDGGQEISAHTAPFPAELTLLEGLVEVQVGERVEPLSAHGLMKLPANVTHGFRALVPSHLLLVMRRGARPEQTGCSGHGHCHSQGHGHSHGFEPEEVRNPLLRQWMNEHAEATRRLAILRGALDQELWGVARDVSDWLATELKTHNRAEEELLFPLLDPHFPGGGPTFVMRREHQQLWDLMDQLGMALSEGDGSAAQESGRQLIEHLRGHIEKENHILYPMAQRLLSAQELEALASVIPG